MTFCYASNFIKIFPIDRAKFLAGQRFDFVVEANTSFLSDDIEVTINGIDTQEFFEKKATIKYNSYSIKQVSFNKEGEIKINVKWAKYNERNISYNVVAPKIQKPAKNVILFIGDGMSLQVKQMARILSKGIVEEKYNDVLEMEKLDRMAIITTSGYDFLTPDSANSASAYATGHKATVGSMGVYMTENTDTPHVENIIEILRRKSKKSIGLVSTANITDATPAAMVSHLRKREYQDIIAFDLLRVKPEVILGGGLKNFLPDEKYNKNLIASYKKNGYEIVYDRDSLKQTESKKILGLFHYDNMNVYLDREMLRNKDVLGEYDKQPTLIDMTKKAIEILSENKDGFFLMVEGGNIDKQLHRMDWQRATYDTIELDKSVAIARDFAKSNGETLIIVVADHAHGASITGTYYEADGKSGRDGVMIYNKFIPELLNSPYYTSIFPTFKDEDKDGFPDDPDPKITLAVQYANHPDYKVYYRFREKPSEPTILKNGKYITNPNNKVVKYAGNIPYDEEHEAHSADDVILMSEGVGSDYFKGVMDNTEVFFGIMRAFGIDAR